MQSINDVKMAGKSRPFFSVMRGLDPRIHHASQRVVSKKMDCRVKPGNDDGVC
jgi:hypothetical protein